MNSFALRAYFRYRLRARPRGHGVHSPFMYALAREVVRGKKQSYAQHAAEQRRRTLLADKRVIDMLDLGTGASGPRRVSAIAARSAKRPAQGQLLHRIVQRFRPAYMLELGTSLGITTLYELHPGIARFISIEGCPAVADIARESLRDTPAEVVTGNFDAVLPAVLAQLPRLDYVYFDGNHRRVPTLRYFESCLALAHNDSVFVFDDIHWSAEMEEAWAAIKAHPRVRVTADLFHFGLVFFRQEQPEEHFVLR